MPHRYLPILFAGLFLAACGRGVQNEAAIRQGVIDYLSSKAGMNVASMDVDVASVTYRQDEADALVSFRLKGGAPGTGMQMRYTLEREGNRWIVKGKGSGHGQASAGQMPQGHPSVGSNQMQGMQMPPGHPQMDGGTNQGMQMPPGHPPIGANESAQPGTNR